MKCPICGTEFDGNYCPKCGNNITQANQQTNSTKSWNNFSYSSLPSKKRNGCLIAIAISVVIFVCITFLGLLVVGFFISIEDTDTATSTNNSSNDITNDLSSDSDKSDSETPDNAQSEQTENAYLLPEKELENLEEIDSSITTTLLQSGYSLEHASRIQKILNQLGITDIVVENMTGNPEDGLNAVVCYPNGYTDRNRRFFFTTENGILFYAGFSDEDLYDSTQGGYLKSYNDVHVPETEIFISTYDLLRELAENDVKNCLQNPQTADFGAFDWGIGRSDDKYQLIGKVTAENYFGEKIEMSFSVWYTESNNTYLLDGLSIDGNRIK